ncbi:hypothetical protein GLOIN_2v1578326 [Rhizophagus clarus]|uniref:Uncharacterized protein n=1 Tax=Rhizophagus clarus TaxID=94130 RepID=A0A8H3QBQ2_9GLOM|nr:hypothetical protein GLOIN_2v1578326 [Rhizophagus clarus]
MAAEVSNKIVIFSGVSLKRYCKFHGKGELKRFNIHVRLVRGEVITYKMSSPVHTLVAATLSHMLLLWSNCHLIIFNKLDITIEVARTESLTSLDDLTVPNLALNVSNPPSNTPPMITMTNMTPNLAISFGMAPHNHQPRSFINNTGISNGRLTGFLQRTNIACTTCKTTS